MNKTVAKAFLASAAFVGLTATGEAAAADVTYTPDGRAQCAQSGNGPEMRGAMSTAFGNQYWSRMACGDYDGAREVLDDAPKSRLERGIPSLLDNQSALAQCFRDSFPYPVEYHGVRVENSPERTVSVKHGFYDIEGKDFHSIQRAVTAACDRKLGL